MVAARGSGQFAVVWAGSGLDRVNQHAETGRRVRKKIDLNLSKGAGQWSWGLRRASNVCQPEFAYGKGIGNWDAVAGHARNRRNDVASYTGHAGHPFISSTCLAFPSRPKHAVHPLFVHGTTQSPARSEEDSCQRAGGRCGSPSCLVSCSAASGLDCHADSHRRARGGRMPPRLSERERAHTQYQCETVACRG